MNINQDKPINKEDEIITNSEEIKKQKMRIIRRKKLILQKNLKKIIKQIIYQKII